MHALELFIPHLCDWRDGVVPGCVTILKGAAWIPQAQLQDNNGTGWPTLTFQDIGVRGDAETDNRRHDCQERGLQDACEITCVSMRGEPFMKGMRAKTRAGHTVF